MCEHIPIKNYVQRFTANYSTMPRNGLTNLTHICVTAKEPNELSYLFKINHIITLLCIKFPPHYVHCFLNWEIANRRVNKN